MNPTVFKVKYSQFHHSVGFWIKGLPKSFNQLVIFTNWYNSTFVLNFSPLMPVHLQSSSASGEQLSQNQPLCMRNQSKRASEEQSVGSRQCRECMLHQQSFLEDFSCAIWNISGVVSSETPKGPPMLGEHVQAIVLGLEIEDSIQQGLAGADPSGWDPGSEAAKPSGAHHCVRVLSWLSQLYLPPTPTSALQDQSWFPWLLLFIFFFLLALV